MVLVSSLELVKRDGAVAILVQPLYQVINLLQGQLLPGQLQLPLGDLAVIVPVHQLEHLIRQDRGPAEILAGDFVVLIHRKVHDGFPDIIFGHINFHLPKINKRCKILSGA